MTSELRVDKIIPVDGVPSDSGSNPLYRGAGGVVQVVYAQTRSQQQTTSSTYVDATNLFVDITPKFSTSKILIQCNCPMTVLAGGDNDQNSGCLKVSRGGSGGVSVDSENRGVSMQYGSHSQYSDVHILFLDSPNTTSSTTYTVMMRRTSGTTTYSFIRDGQQTASLVLMEISA